MMFRHLMQTLDLMMLDVDFYNHEPRNLALSALLLGLGLNFDFFTLETLNDSSLFTHDSPFGTMLSHFTETACSLPNLQLIQPSLNYASLFYT